MPILLCAPIYAPDPGHENHWNFGGPFYAVIHREWKGAVTSLESLEKILERYPGAKVWQAEPWSTFQSRWNIDCTEYHYHPEEEGTVAR
ncbi:hypothetical protein B0H10DRAFT_2232129 [Mycena sp. CBHHK59/15]|nr:hypothetical protein B0H10DRAFT_2232129 [Mycena sp. CBHHK59/15]